MTDCDCPPLTCSPERNEGRRCWRSGFAVPEGYFSEADRVRLWRAENALLSASMGVMEPMQQYMQDYREPVERPATQPEPPR